VFPEHRNARRLFRKCGRDDRTERTLLVLPSGKAKVVHDRPAIVGLPLNVVAKLPFEPRGRGSKRRPLDLSVFDHGEPVVKEAVALAGLNRRARLRLRCSRRIGCGLRASNAIIHKEKRKNDAKATGRYIPSSPEIFRRMNWVVCDFSRKMTRKRTYVLIRIV
jgi:hypothetical protein